MTTCKHCGEELDYIAQICGMDTYYACLCPGAAREIEQMQVRRYVLNQIAKFIPMLEWPVMV